jgi:hypothetical protein
MRYHQNDTKPAYSWNLTQGISMITHGHFNDRIALEKDAGIRTTALPDTLNHLLLFPKHPTEAQRDRMVRILEKRDLYEIVRNNLVCNDPAEAHPFVTAFCTATGPDARAQEAGDFMQLLPLAREGLRIHEVTLVKDAQGKDRLFANYGDDGSHVIVQLMKPGFPAKVEPRARIQVDRNHPDEVMKLIFKTIEQEGLNSRESAALAETFASAVTVMYDRLGNGDLHSVYKTGVENLSGDLRQLALAFAMGDKAEQNLIREKHALPKLGWRSLLPQAIIDAFGRKDSTRPAGGGEVVKLKPKSQDASIAL